jgi:integrase
VRLVQGASLLILVGVTSRASGHISKEWSSDTLSSKDGPRVYHTTGFNKDEITELCALVHATGISSGGDGYPPALQRAGVENATRADGTHALRHCYALALLEGGVRIKAVSEYLGHADPGFTLRTYTHLMPATIEADG